MFGKINSIKTGIADGRLTAVVRGSVCGHEMEYTYRTSHSGRGLWEYVGRGEWRQVLGTAQFSADSRRQFREKLRARLGIPSWLA